ncbi:peptidylprolyl isomerase [Heliophilum fasciatum]|uniref:peptidylprolyl isomerase n=1 Tax=Heliophilum fasciatum TaxID=35700 RepID=A0A4R2RN41_9FIRM|nr:peptidylprolyl isomerase [Heliophilum fasciatum]MCW2277982.1 cyclophilin family peptidyl-prolyl cis-trans isomerase [Heliophilum fasciatum]TCP64398.1 cyclophilin family peptidyl-prolyl cis-trans isomerase [Heliophilum fasciatum]
MMKRVIPLCLALGVLTGGITVASAAPADSIELLVDGAPVQFEQAKPYINEDNRTMVPLFFISQHLGAQVEWNGEEQKVTIRHQGQRITLTINEKTAYLNGQAVTMPTAPVIQNDRTMVPLAFVSQTLGADVLWRQTPFTIRISTKGPDPAKIASRNGQYKSAPVMKIDAKKKYVAEVETNRGTFKIQLLAADAPQTVNNFVFLAREGFYDGVRFHRIIKDFMIQTGDPLGNGMGGPGYKFKDELPAKIPYAPGVVAMANSGPNTNGSQFFIGNGEQVTYLNENPNYTVFGQVMEGMEAIQTISDTPVLTGSNGEASKPAEDIYIKKVKINELD